MDFAAVFIMIIVLLALVGVLVFLVWDYMTFKTNIQKDLVKTPYVSDVVAKEKSERLSNMKYIVDQVNTVNTDIYKTFSSNVMDNRNAVTRLSASNQKIITGIDSVFGFNIDGNNVSLMNLPGNVNPDLELIANVTALSGMNIQELSSNVGTKFCSAADENRCIRFPNDDGDTYITTMYPNRNVVIDGQTVFRNRITFANANTNYAELASMGSDNRDTLFRGQNHIMLQATTGRVGVGQTPVNAPEAMLHVNAPNTGDIFRASSANPNMSPVRIANDGTLIVNRLQIGGGTNPIRIEQNPQNMQLMINSPPGIMVSTEATGSQTRFLDNVVFDKAPTASNSSGTTASAPITTTTSPTSQGTNTTTTTSPTSQGTNTTSTTSQGTTTTNTAGAGSGGNTSTTSMVK